MLLVENILTYQYHTCICPHLLDFANTLVSEYQITCAIVWRSLCDLLRLAVLIERRLVTD